MYMLQRLSVWGVIVGWLLGAVAAKTIRGDNAGLWIRLDFTLAVSVSMVLVSCIGVALATFARRANTAQR